MALGTMLQMRPEMWPADRPAFDKYWEEQLENIPHRRRGPQVPVPDRGGPAAWSRVARPLQNINESVALMITTGFRCNASATR